MHKGTLAREHWLLKRGRRNVRLVHSHTGRGPGCCTALTGVHPHSDWCHRMAEGQATYTLGRGSRSSTWT